MSIESNTSPASKAQKDHLEKLIRDEARASIDESDFNKDQAQRLIEGGPRAMRALLIAMLGQNIVTDQYADEEVESGYGYLSGYRQANAATDQFAAIKNLFPQAESYDPRYAAKDVPVGSEGNFLIMPWQKVAPTYGEAVQIILDKLSEQRGGKFYNYRSGQLGPRYLREGDKKIKAMKKIATEQSGHDVLVVSAQLGIRHRGRSVRRALAVMGGNEFGLGAYEIGFILLTHQNRLQHFDDLWIDAAGDEFAPGTDVVFSYAPFFDFHDEDLRFFTGGIVGPRDGCGSASAFVPPVVVPSE